MRDYQLTDPTQRQRMLANPMAAKLGSGAGQYDDQTNWAFTVFDDWQAGVLQLLPQDGGPYYAEIDSRFRRQLSLPLAMSMNGTKGVDHTSFAASQTGRIAQIVGASSKRSLAYRWHKEAATIPDVAHVLMWCRYVANNSTPDGIGTTTVAVTVKLYKKDGASLYVPTAGTLVDTANAYVPASLNLQPVLWELDVSNTEFNQIGDYWLILEAPGSATLEVYCWVNATSDQLYPYYNGTTWIASTDRLNGYRGALAAASWKHPTAAAISSRGSSRPA